ncbi:hypothetical protein ABZZ93_002472 [Listeria monocytogenes]|uniref:hypothetical protein n=1 Tax=Listeria monocytogenes TaxID=1639 RepID=UPI000EE1C626|nr:hypothetical protein [Listeria monocytogenes]ECH7281017.1 hypothetical protein [Listeria monocytogenes]EKZ1004359.1 hypothetical protein [Listeria monocytogenes]EKZ1010024.1 hypothetical protein [Listeria monocytogenes]MCJ39177.1 hypothetical protein [Listeria monocytogenes]
MLDSEDATKLSKHAYNSLFKTRHKDIMLDDIKDALKVEPVPAKSGSVEYINPNIKTSVFVNPPPKKHLIFYKINLVNLITKAGEDKPLVIRHSFWRI